MSSFATSSSRSHNEAQSSSAGSRRVSVGRDHWTDSSRRDPYWLPPPEDALWNQVTTECTRDNGAAIRVLYSRNTRGFLVFDIEDNGTARITNWCPIDDLLQWNPLQYFITHPNINEVWIETVDTDEYSESDADTDPSGLHTVAGSVRSRVTRSTNSARSLGSDSTRSDDTAAPPNYAIVIRRREYTCAVANILRSNQAHFFLDQGIGMPDASCFRDTLHGR